MKSSIGAVTALVVFATAFSLTAQVINQEVVRLTNIAKERLEVRDWDSAERDYLHALDIATGSETKPTLAALRQNLGVLYANENHYKDAEKQLRLSYELLKAEFGEQNPKTAVALNTIGEVTCFEGRFAAARSLFERSLSVLNAQTPKDAEMARVLTNLAATQWLLGNLTKADRALEQATSILEKAGRDWEPQLAFALQIRGRIADQVGNFEGAEAYCQKALCILERCGEPQDLAASLVTSGRRLLRRGQPQEAQARLDRALQLVRNDAAEESPVGGALMSTLAQCYHMQGRSREANSLFERAIGIDRRVLGPDHPVLLSAMQEYARFLRAIKRKKDAKKLESYVRTHPADSADVNSMRDVVDLRQLFQERKH